MDKFTKNAGTPGHCVNGEIPFAEDPRLSPDLLADDPELHSLLLGLSSTSGPGFYESMTRSLAGALGVKYAVLAEFVPDCASARSLAFWNGEGFLAPVEWQIRGTPCRGVIEGQFTHFPERLNELFPEDTTLVKLGAESYLGVPLHTPGGEVLGHLFVMDTRPMPRAAKQLALFRVFAALAAKELARQRLEESLRDSEERFRDLFDEAPIAYVHEGLDTKFLRANAAAMRILGIRPDEVEGSYGHQFIPDTPEAQQRLREAFESVGRGADTSGLVLELRRRDNGNPVWIQWWSKPDPSRSYTRTMFVDITDKVLMEREQARLREQNTYLSEEIRSIHNFGDIVGESPVLRRVLDNVERVAPTNSTVLIQGETGTGKELIARAIHERSGRAGGPFVKVNCAALPAGLVESEFFGHEKGAFTGAVTARKGRFEVADGGTIFLDEVGDVSPDVQVKLLRVLQESEFERVGGSQTIRVNVRVIAATNRDLSEEVRAGRFRADLYYRVGVFPVSVPPLRARTGDVPLLTRCFVEQLAPAVGPKVESIDGASLDRLCRYAWPGNIRELRNVIERALIIAEGPELRISDADLGLIGPVASYVGQTLDEVEAAHIRSVLDSTGGVIAGDKGAAKILGVPPSTLRSRMTKLGITG